MDPEVRAVFDQYPEPTRERLLSLRELVYTTAAETEGVGPLEETLKWGQISYLNPAGTTLRIGTVKGSPDQIAIYVHCQTSIVETLRELYTGVLEFEGNRCIILPLDDVLPIDEVRHCIQIILTYRLNRQI
ncbi:MAG: DUF1801 domain-containing protein [Chloroflexota bacterium]